MVSTTLSSNLMSISAKKIGGSTSPISPITGSIFVLRVFSCLSGSPSSSTYDPVMSFVGAVYLHKDCPPSLLRALTGSHPDREVWLQSYYAEKPGVENLGTFRKISLGKYCALREKGAPKAILTMCILTIKKDENLLPLHAKSRIVVLGNHENRVWSKSHQYALVLCGNSLRFPVSLAVEKCCPLRQGDCKDTFCQEISPLMRSQLFALLQGIPRQIQTNIGSSFGLSTVFEVVLVTGMTK